MCAEATPVTLSQRTVPREHLLVEEGTRDLIFMPSSHHCCVSVRVVCVRSRAPGHLRHRGRIR